MRADSRRLARTRHAVGFALNSFNAATVCTLGSTDFAFLAPLPMMLPLRLTFRVAAAVGRPGVRPRSREKVRGRSRLGSAAIRPLLRELVDSETDFR